MPIDEVPLWLETANVEKDAIVVKALIIIALGVPLLITFDKSISNSKNLFIKYTENDTPKLYNSGNHYRDFTYIDDVVKILYKLNSKKFTQNCVYNVCSNNPVNISRVVKYIIKKIEFKKIINSKKNTYEIIKTHGDNSKIIKKLNYKKFSNIFHRIDNIIIWFNKYWKLI